MAPQKTEVQQKKNSHVNLKENEKEEPVTLEPQMRKVDYLWYAFMYLTLFFMLGWYYLMYFAQHEQQDYTRYDHKRFGLDSQEELKEAFAKYKWPKVSELWICVAVAFVHEFCSRASTPLLTSYFEAIITAKGTNEFKQAKIEKMVIQTYKGTYFAFSSFICWYLMNKGKFLPWFMGGSYSNNLKYMYNNYPMVERIDYLPEFVLICGGYHIWGTYNHLMSKVKRNDHIEMLVHHLITIGLFSGGHVMGDYSSGIIAIYITDFTDLWVHFAKATCDTHWKLTCDFFGVQMWFWWAYCRIFCLPFCLYYMLFTDPFDIPNMSGSYEGYLYIIKGSMVSMLVIMSVWWFYLISQILYKAIFKGKQEDLHNKIE